MSNHVLDKTYTVEEAGGVAAHRIVVAGSADGSVKYPTKANDGPIIGITLGEQATEGGVVAVRKLGIALLEASAAIAYGSPVNIAGTTGLGKLANEDGEMIYHVGWAETSASAAGDLVEVFLNIETGYTV